MNVAEYTLQQLAVWGVRHMYGVIGDAILPLMDAVAKQTQIRFVPVRHESAAGFMAAAEHKLTGGLAVCVGTSGPGFANLINGLGDAYADRAPVLVLTGQVESYKVGTNVKQQINQQGLMDGFAGYTALLAGPGAAPQVLLTALKTAVGEGRVAQVSVPKDYWSAELPDASPRPPEPYLTAAPCASVEMLQAAAHLLREAQRPLVLAGHGARPVAGALLELAEALGAGVIVASGGKGMVPGDHPLVLGGVGAGGSDAAHQALQQADLVFVAGSTWWPSGYMPQQVKVVQVDRCPANIGAKHPVTYGLAADSRQVLPALAAELKASPGAGRSGWRQHLEQWKAAWNEKLAREASAGAPGDGASPGGGAPPDGAVPPAVLVQAVERVAPAGTVIAIDTSDILLWFNRHFAGDGQVPLFSGTWRSMGYGLPAASAAKLCAPGARVIALVGDGGLTMSLGELAVPVQQGLDITVVVVRNGALGLEEHKARSQGFTPFGHQLNNPDFAAVARAFGWMAWTVNHVTELQGALDQAVAHQGPSLVDVATLNDGSLHKPKQGAG
jgi:pyruvate oxidase